MRMRLDPTVLFRRAVAEPDDWQVAYLRDRAPKLLLVTARQIGKSAATACLAVHHAWTHPGTTTIVIAPSGEQSALLIDRARIIAAALPSMDRPSLDSRTRLGFPSGSRVVALPGDRPSSPRGWTVDGLLIADEAGWIKSATWEAALPTVADDAADVRTRVLSTPNGRTGFLWELWSSGREDWRTVSVPATESSRYTAHRLSVRRADLGEQRYAAEYECAFTTSPTSFFHPDWLADADTWDDHAAEHVDLFGELRTREEQPA